MQIEHRQPHRPHRVLISTPRSTHEVLKVHQLCTLPILSNHDVAAAFLSSNESSHNCIQRAHWEFSPIFFWGKVNFLIYTRTVRGKSLASVLHFQTRTHTHTGSTQHKPDRKQWSSFQSYSQRFSFTCWSHASVSISTRLSAANFH